MIVELIVNRGWYVLVDGQKPKTGWNAPEDDGTFNPPLRIDRPDGTDHISKIVTLRQNGLAIGLQDDWIEDDEFGPIRPVWLAVEINNGFKSLKITHIVYGSGTSATELLITTADGEQHDIDEVTTYIRAEG